MKLGYAPSVDDPDAPERMTDEEIEAMAERLARNWSNAKKFAEARAKSLVLLGKAEWNEEDHPRDADGKFGSGGGGGSSSSKPAGGKEGDGKDKGEHPGKGYSKAAYVDKKGVIQTSNVDDAARALHENRKVNLDQPRGVSVLLNKLAGIAKDAKEKGEKAPDYNLCNVTVGGSNLFCSENKGIPRVEMPQLSDEQTKKFVEHLKKEGYEVKEEDQFASHLRATQNELHGTKVAGMMDWVRSESPENMKRTIVSNDDYILDGHHHWAAKIGVDAEDGNLTNDTKVPISRINIPIIELLKHAEAFSGEKAGMVAEIGKAAAWKKAKAKAQALLGHGCGCGDKEG